MRFRARKDTAHKPIADGLEREGVIVLDTSQLGGGFPDILAWNDGREKYTLLAAWLDTMADRPTVSTTDRAYLRDAAHALAPLAKHGLWLPAEIKSDNAISHQKKSDHQLKPAQKKLHADVPIPVIRTVDDGKALFGIGGMI